MTESKRLNLARLKRESDVEGLIQALSAKVSSKTRRAAAAALGDLGDTRAVEALITSMGNGLLVESAAEALAKIGDQRSVDALIACLSRPPPMDGSVPTSGVEAAAFATVALAKVDPSGSIDRLIAVARNEDEYEEVRVRAITVLGRMNRPEANEFLAIALSDSALNKLTVRGVGDGGGAMLDPALLVPLASMLNDPDWQVRGAAVTALGRIDDTRVTDTLIEALEDEIYDVRRRAVIALTDRGDQSAIGALQRTAERETDAREWVLMRLRDMQTASAVEQWEGPGAPNSEEDGIGKESRPATAKPWWKVWG